MNLVCQLSRWRGVLRALAIQTLWHGLGNTICEVAGAHEAICDFHEAIWT